VRHASNRFAIVAPVVGGAIHFAAAAFTGSDFASSFRASFFGGGATFLGWAIGRELDPDDPAAASVAAGVAFALAFVGDPYLAVGGLLLIATRVVARTTGRPPQPIDLVILPAAAGYVATRPAGALAVAALALALTGDRMLPGKTPARNVAAGIAVIAVGAVAALVAGGLPEWSSPSIVNWAIVAGGVAAAGLSLTIPDPVSLGDYTDERLHHVRTQAARVLALSLATAYVAMGAAGITGLTPVWSAFLGAATTAVRRRI
jgi:hypothetical protein